MKKCVVIIMLLAVMLACGCGNKDKEPDINKTPDYKDILQTSSEIDFGDITYNFETDSQNYFDFDSSDVAAAKDGYYTYLDLEHGVYLAYMDKNEGVDKKYLPVCSRPDCMHDNKECDANFEDIKYNGNLYSLKYYDGGLYSVLVWFDTKKLTYYLYNISTDGAARNKIFELYSAPRVDGFVQATAPQFNIHRGYVYYTFDSGDYSYLYRCRLDGTEKENICKKNSSDGTIGEICGYGDGVMVTMYHGYSNNEICYFSNKTGKLYQIKTDVNATYCLDGYDMICTDGSCMKKINLKDMSEQVIAEDIDGVVKSSYDGRYIYIDNFSEENRMVYIYDTSGNYVDEISIEQRGADVCFGDDRWLFVFGGKKTIIDKSQIGTGRFDTIDIDISAFDAMEKEY